MEFFISNFITIIWRYVSDMIVISSFIAVISCLFTESVKISYEKVFIKNIAPALFLWIINIFVSLTSSISFVIVFKLNENIIQMIFNVFLLSFFSWAISILGYSIVIKLFFLIVEILLLKFKEIKTNTENKLIENKNIQLKNEKILTEYLKIINSLIKKEEDTDIKLKLNTILSGYFKKEISEDIQNDTITDNSKT